VPDLDEPTDMRSTFVVEATEWKPTVRAAIASAMDEEVLSNDRADDPTGTPVA